MNRIIKFRAWVDNGSVKEMHYPHGIQMNSADAEALWYAVGFENVYPERRVISDWQKEIIWMQFTGLLDRHGKEIYEGDIYRWGDMVGVVTFERGCFIFRHRHGSGTVSMNMQDHQESEFEVIGNIHEHRNLLPQ